MNQHKSYVPQNDAHFNQFFSNLIRYAEQKCAGSPPEWAHIPPRDLAALNAIYSAWEAAYTPTLKPHTPPETREKNRVRKAAEKQLRNFVNQYLHFPPVTDADRDAMGIPNHDGSRSPQNPPSERVEFSFRIKGIRQVQVDFRVQGAANKARPAHYAGAVLVWDVLDKPPARPEDLTNHALASRTPYAIEFDETQRGKTVYAALCWENEKGQTGPWSEVQAAIVP